MEVTQWCSLPILTHFEVPQTAISLFRLVYSHSVFLDRIIKKILKTTAGSCVASMLLMRLAMKQPLEVTQRKSKQNSSYLSYAG